MLDLLKQVQTERGAFFQRSPKWTGTRLRRTAPTWSGEQCWDYAPVRGLEGHASYPVYLARWLGSHFDSHPPKDEDKDMDGIAAGIPDNVRVA